MTETTLYERLLGIERPWRVHDVRLALERGDVEVGVELVGETLVCPACGAACPGYDRRRRVWRHLDTMQYRTLVRAEVPRVRCAEHGVRQVPVPWADAQARFTALFEAMVIDWLQVASFAAVARQCRLSWDQVAGIQARAVRRGLSRRAVAAAPLVGVDETSFQRRHEYVTVVNDLTASEPRVLYVADGRDRAALDGYFDAVGEAGCAQIEMVAMDMWPAYIGSVHDHTEAPIAFDKFHIAQHLGAAVDQVRRSENRALRQQGDDRLAKTRYLWLTRPANLDAAATPGVHAAAHERVAGGPCVGDQGIGDAAVALPVAGLGGPHVEPLVRVGDSQSVGADQEGRADDQAPLGRGDQCGPDQRHERALRGHQRQDPVDQAAGLRISQPRAVPQRHLLPSGRARPLPERARCPHEFLKRLFFWGNRHSMGSTRCSRGLHETLIPSGLRHRLCPPFSSRRNAEVRERQILK